jgi:hypothetical protein
MKATLEFSLPEERDEYIFAVNSGEMHGVLRRLDEAMRAMLKHGFPDELPDRTALAEKVRRDISEVLRLVSLP